LVFRPTVVHNWHFDKTYDLRIDKRYPNSNFRFDFELTHKKTSTKIFIEICPMMVLPGFESYATKMETKQSLFNSHLLVLKNDIDEFFKRLKDAG
jgi:hypothetical protein